MPINGGLKAKGRTPVGIFVATAIVVAKRTVGGG
jgi:hypothetical protein